MASNFSPFANITETKTHPHSRTLRTTFTHKLWDTYDVIAGSDNNTSIDHVGIFDYLTLFFPFALATFTKWCNERNYSFFVIPLTIINILLFIPRAALGIVTTILFSPIIAIVHGVSSWFANPYYSDVLDVVGVTTDHFGNNEDEAKLSFREYLVQNQRKIEDGIECYVKPSERVTEDNSPNSYALMFRVGFQKFHHVHESEKSFCVKISRDAMETKQLGSIHALFALNIGNATTLVEETNVLNDEDKRFILAI